MGKLKEVNCCVRDEKVKLPAVRRTDRKIENTTRVVSLLKLKDVNHIHTFLFKFDDLLNQYKTSLLTQTFRIGIVLRHGY